MNEVRVNPIVGSKECPINTIASILKTPTIHEKWTTLARNLNMNSYTISKWRKDLRLEKVSASDIIHDILETWVAGNGSEASVWTLIKAVEKEGEIAVGEFLRLKFNLPCMGWDRQNPSLSWSNLSPAFQAKVSGSLAKLLPTHESQFPTLTAFLEPQILIDLMTVRRPLLFRNALPEKLPYYVCRSLVSRNCLDKEQIFGRFHSTDIFMFTGISRSELSRLAKDNTLTGESSEQLRHPNVSFMVINQAIHFERIWESTGRSVHLIHHENGVFRWIKSKGWISFLQKCVGRNQDMFTEEEFLKNLTLGSRHHQPICISDTPGMGKSTVLAYLGQELKKEYPERVVLFLSMSQLVTKYVEGESKPIKVTVKDILKELICRNELENAVFDMKFHSKSITVELLLDGFDEVQTSRVPTAIELLRHIQSSLKSIRLWVTTRPHYLKMIEDTLTVLGYSINSFSEEDQVEFLVRFWHHRGGQSKDFNRNTLQRFARDCLRNIGSSLKSRDRDADGLPLQCRLIGEVYEDEIINGVNETESGITYEFSSSSNLCHSITDLYKFVITTKLQKYADVHVGENVDTLTQPLMDMHMQLALELLFPEHFKNLRSTFQPVNMEDVLNVGIVERVGDIEQPNFIHRTFAGYFVALFVIDKLGGREEDWNADLTRLLLDGIFDCQGMDYESLVNEVWDIEAAKQKLGKLTLHSMDQNKSLEGPKAPQSKQSIACFKFAHPTICNFINCFMKSDSRLTTYKTRSRFSDDFDVPSYLQQITVASSYQDLYEIQLFFNGTGLLKKHARRIFTGGMMIVAVLRSCLEFVKLAFDYYKEHNERDLVEQSGAAVLNVALMRGEFSLVEFLLKEKQLRMIVEGLTGTKKCDFLHNTVSGTSFNSEEQISQRVEILRMLSINNPSYHVMRKDMDGNLPTFTKNVHARLIIELITLGANVLEKDTNENTIIHMNSTTNSHFTPSDYQAVLEMIPQRKLKKLANIVGQYDLTPLGSVVSFFDPTPKTFDIFKDAGAKYNHVDPNSYSILFYAIFRGRNSCTIRRLIQLGADIEQRGKQGETLLHTATMAGNVDAVEVLLEHGCDINALSYQGGTPLDLLLFSDLPGVEERTRMEMGTRLVKLGGKLDLKTNEKGETLLHRAAQRGRVSSVKLLLELEFDANAVDEEGNTPLHFTMENDENDDAERIFQITKILIDHDADPNMVNNKGEAAFNCALRNPDVDLRTFQLRSEERRVGKSV